MVSYYFVPQIMQTEYYADFDQSAKLCCPRLL
jgi:hypothetical protein